MLMTGMPSSSSICRKKGIFAHSAGTSRFMMSQGTAETYSSATTLSPERRSRCFTVPSGLTAMDSSGQPNRTSPPLASTCSTIGAQSRCGWFPSRKAICRPSVSLRKRFMAVNTTVMESLSGSMKSSALAIAMKTSSLIRSGMPYWRMNCRTERSSCLSMNFCPSTSIGSSGGAVCSFSGIVNIFWLSRIARAKFKGAGTPSKKSKVVNSPGRSCIAKIIWWRFHCRRSSMPSSEKRFIMFGYAPKNMCRPVSIQSPSSSCHADTLPPRTSRASKTIGL
mmetsp:Transcript_76657/g.228487  ORF Transcript_76657/g.228487 Transcript_76657/m.228487 type:complete len:279 (+) Transcript_76657:1174-2010(+)